MRTKQGRAGQGKGQPDHWLTWQAGVAGKSGWAAECLLRQYGIAVQKRRLAYSVEDSYGVLIRGSQAIWAEYLLMAGGFALNSRLLDPKHRDIQREAMPPTWGKPAKPAGVTGWLYRLVGMLQVGDTTAGMKTKSSKGRRQTDGAA